MADSLISFTGLDKSKFTDADFSRTVRYFEYFSEIIQCSNDNGVAPPSTHRDNIA